MRLKRQQHSVDLALRPNVFIPIRLLLSHVACNYSKIIDMAPQDVRKRGTASAKSSTPKSGSATTSSQPKAQSTGSSGIVEGLRIFFALVLLAGGISWVVTGESFIFNWRKLPTLLGEVQRYMVCSFLYLITPCLSKGLCLTWRPSERTYLTERCPTRPVRRHRPRPPHLRWP